MNFMDNPAHLRTVVYGNCQQYKTNVQATEHNYWHFRETDFDPINDETVKLPHASYGKHYFSNFYDQPGNDWEVAAPMFVAECLHK